MNDHIDKSHYYRLIDMNEESLKLELSKWCREDLINFLVWNDPNGVYKDQDSLDEIGNIMSYEEGVEIITRQIIQK